MTLECINPKDLPTPQTYTQVMAEWKRIRADLQAVLYETQGNLSPEKFRALDQTQLKLKKLAAAATGEDSTEE